MENRRKLSKKMLLVSTIAGGLAAYMFLSFSLDLGVRAAKLAVLKLIAPDTHFSIYSVDGNELTYMPIRIALIEN